MCTHIHHTNTRKKERRGDRKGEGREEERKKGGKDLSKAIIKT